MKKTIIVLFALAGVVGAEETAITLTSSSTVISGNSPLTWKETSAPLTLTSWKVAFDVELENKANKTGIGNAPIFSTTRGSRNNITGSTGIVFESNSNGTVGIYHRNNENGLSTPSTDSSDSVFSIDKSTSITISFVADYVWGEYKGGTFLVTAGEKELLNFTVDETIPDTTLISGSASVWTQSGDGAQPHKNLFSNITVSRLADNVIPEPTTATLSLLALAGLAARRRRK